MHVADVWFKRLYRRMTGSIAAINQLDLLWWFSIVSFLLISVFAFGLGTKATRCLVTESIERDALPIPGDHSHA